MSQFSTPAILLRRISHGDHDLILTFLTLEKGKIAAIAKHAKKSVKRFAGVLEPFSLMDLVCSKGRGELLVLQEATLIHPHDRIRCNMHKTAYANYWSEIMHIFMEEGRPQNSLYELLKCVLSALDSERMTPEVLSLFFQMRFLSLAGLSPELAECCTCRQPLEHTCGNRLTPRFNQGSLVCETCLPWNARHMSLTKGTVKKLKWINSADMRKAERIRFSPQAIQEGLAFLEMFVAFQLGREPRSLGVLREIRKK